MIEVEQIPVDDTTRADAEVVNLAREQIKRRLRLVNERDLLQARARIRPEAATKDPA